MEVTRRELVHVPLYTNDKELLGSTEDKDMSEEELEAICEEFRKDYNRHHFVRNREFEGAADKLDPETREVFIEFLEQSCTSEFSGFLLYKLKQVLLSVSILIDFISAKEESFIAIPILLCEISTLPKNTVEFSPILTPLS